MLAVNLEIKFQLHNSFRYRKIMAYRCRSLSKPAFSVFRSAMNKPSPRPKSASSFLGVPPSPGPARPIAQLASLQSLLPFHSAVSSARLTSCLGIENSRSLSQELGRIVPP